MDYDFSERVKNLSGNAIREIFKVLGDKEMISFAGGMPAGGMPSCGEGKGICRRTSVGKPRRHAAIRGDRGIYASPQDFSRLREERGH